MSEEQAVVEQTEDEKLKEEEQILAYLEGDLVDPGIEDADRIEYLETSLARYEAEFKNLWLQREEVKSAGNDDMIGKINGAMRKNYTYRKNAIKSLLKLGVKVNNPFGIL